MALPTTTPLPSGARVRPGARGGLDLLIPNPAAAAVAAQGEERQARLQCNFHLLLTPVAQAEGRPDAARMTEILLGPEAAMAVLRAG